MYVAGDRGLSEAQIALEAAKLGARYHLVMNNPGLANALKTAGQVIYRHWEDDDNVQNKADPNARVELLHRLAPPGTLLYLGNEPGEADPARKLDLGHLARWTLIALQRCTALGRRGVFFNFAVGNPEPGDWAVLNANGVLDYAYAHGHLLGLHQYFDKTITTGFPYLVGRERDVRSLLGPRCPEIVITELACAVDLDPYKGWRKALTSEAYAAQLGEAAAYYSAHNIHAIVFARVNDNDSKWGSFALNGPLIDAMAAVNRKVSTPPVIVTPPTDPASTTAADVPKPTDAVTIDGSFKGVIQTSTWINVRGAPALMGRLVGTARQGDAVTVYPGTERIGDGKEWRWIEGADFAGWMALVHSSWTQQFAARPATTFRLMLPMKWTYAVTGNFDDPRDYSQIAPGKLQKHEGIDFAPLRGGPVNPEVYAAARGRVTYVGYKADGYGHYVCVETLVTTPQGETERFVVWYAHLKEVRVAVSDTVTLTTVIGIAGTTGMSTGVHLHLTLQWIGRGLANYVVDDVVDPALFLGTVPVDDTPVVTPLPEPGLMSLLLSVDEARQFQAALIAERDAKNTQIRIIAAALARAGRRELLHFLQQLNLSHSTAYGEGKRHA